MTEVDADLPSYYSARANEYEEVYAKPERQDDLRELHRIVPSYLAGRHVLDVACGTGYWTRLIASEAASVTGCDLSPEVLALARSRQPGDHPATFVIGDAFALHEIEGAFDAAFTGFWWSHVPHHDLSRFLRGLHGRLGPGGRVMALDNRYVRGSNWPITRTDAGGNTYQRRRLARGGEYEVLKNFPSADEVRAVITASSRDSTLRVHEMEYYWYATYTLPGQVVRTDSLIRSNESL
jgi:SAM-dependent methyltransferase